MANHVHGVRETDPLEEVQALMRRVQVRRVPVLDEGGRLRGILSMSDMTRHADRSACRKAYGLSRDSIAQTLSAIGEPHPVASAKEPAAKGSPAQLSA